MEIETALLVVGVILVATIFLGIPAIIRAIRLSRRPGLPRAQAANDEE